MSDRGTDRTRGTMEDMGRSIGETVGRMAGKAADTAAEMARPLFNSAAEVLGGWWSGDSAREAATFDEGTDRRWRQHYEGHGTGSGAGKAGSSYEDVRPYYQLGHTASRNPEYASRNFQEVEPDLQRVWSEGDAGSEEWPEARGFVEFGYGQGKAHGSAGGELGGTSGETGGAGGTGRTDTP